MAGNYGLILAFKGKVLKTQDLCQVIPYPS